MIASSVCCLPIKWLHASVESKSHQNPSLYTAFPIVSHRNLTNNVREQRQASSEMYISITYSIKHVSRLCFRIVFRMKMVQD